MFSDLVGSTALSARMDPEDLREVISAYQKCVAETVGRFSGFVAKYMGDGVLVYFGYPQAHEDDVLIRERPVLMIFEDVHWIDPTSLEALGRAVDRIRTLGVLLIVTYRPEFEPPWIGRPYVTALTVNRLGEREIAAIIDRVTGNNPLPASIRQDIIDRTVGIVRGGNDQGGVGDWKRGRGRLYSITVCSRSRKSPCVADGAA